MAAIGRRSTGSTPRGWRRLQARGVAFAALNYALAPMVAMDEIVRQARAAVAWL
jgi:hypothetical protein